MTYAQRLRKLANSTGLDAFGDEIRAIADEMDAQPADVTDEQINAVALEQWGPHAGGPLAAHRAFARAILALRHERVPMTDEQISLEAHNADDRDWNDLRFRSSWHEGFLEGARFAEAHHSITAQAKKEGA